MKTLSEQIQRWGRESLQRDDKRMLGALRASAAKQRAWDREIERRKARSLALGE